MGPVGEKTFLLPQTQNATLSGLAITPKLNYKDYKDGVVQLNIKPVSMPEGASFGMWLTGDLGGPGEILVDSTKDDFTIDTTFPTHTHTNWAFSKPGTYVFEVTYTAETTDGRSLLPSHSISPWQWVTKLLLTVPRISQSQSLHQAPRLRPLL